MKKRCVGFLLAVIMIASVFPVSGFAAQTDNTASVLADLSEPYIPEGSLVYGSSGTIKRAEWLHDLAIIFGMSVDAHIHVPAASGGEGAEVHLGPRMNERGRRLQLHAGRTQVPRPQCQGKAVGLQTDGVQVQQLHRVVPQ